LKNSYKDLVDSYKDKIAVLKFMDYQIRIKTLSDNGYNPTNDDSFKAYMLACGKYINYHEVREQVVWMKYDKARKGILEINSSPPLDFSVYDLNKKEIHFSKLISKTKPNIIISGSYSWPPFRVHGINQLNSWSTTYGDKINLIVIYISEAHADDEWPISNVIKINQTTDINKRIEVAKKYLSDSKFNIYVDNCSKNNYETLYAGWPERGYIILDNKIKLICRAKINDYVRWTEEIQGWLDKNL